MFNIIKSDLYRMFKSKGIYICLFFIILMIGVSLYTLEPGSIGVSNASTDSLETSTLSVEELEEIDNTNSMSKIRQIMKKNGGFSLDKEIISKNANLYYIFIAIVVIILVGDLSNSTIKNTLSSAISRKKYYFSKLITCLMVCTILLLLNNYGMYFSNILLNGKEFSSGLLEITKCTLVQIPIIYGIISLLVCFGFMFKKTSIFNSITIPLIILAQIILSAIISLFKLNATDIFPYEFQYMLSYLISDPTTTYIIKSILLGVVYIITFNIIGYISFKKAEIK